VQRYILVPLDASPFAEQALDQAYELASAMNGTLQLVSIVPPPHVLPIHIHKEKESQSMMRALHHQTVRVLPHLSFESASLIELAEEPRYGEKPDPPIWNCAAKTG